MLESKNGVCGNESEGCLEWPLACGSPSYIRKNFVSHESESENSLVVKSDMIIVA